MNNDLEKKAVVDTGKNAAAKPKKKSSGQAGKPSSAKNSVPKKKSVQYSENEKPHVKKSSGGKPVNTAKSSAKKPYEKRSDGSSKAPEKKSAATVTGNVSKNNEKTSNTKNPNAYPNARLKSSNGKKSGNAQNSEVKKSTSKKPDNSAKNTAKKSNSPSAQKPQNKQQKNKTAVKVISEYPEDEKIENNVTVSDGLSEENFDREFEDAFNDAYESNDVEDVEDVEEPEENEENEEKEDIDKSKDIKNDTEKLSGAADQNTAENERKNEKKRHHRLFVTIPIVTAAVILTTGVIMSSAALGIFDSTKHDAFAATEQSNSNLSSPSGKFLDGISVQGINLGGRTMKQAKEMLAGEEANLIPSINYTLTCHDKIVYLTEDDFEFDFDTVKILNEAYEYSEYMRQVLMDKGRANLRNSEKKDYPISINFNEDSIRKACEKVAEKVNVEMENAHVTNINTEKEYLPEMFSFAEGVVGYTVNVDDLVTQITTLKNSDNFSADIIGQMTAVEPKTDLEDLLKNFVLISKYETYSGNTWAGNMNMTVAMQSMTGSVIKPGEVFSFNGKTGDSNLPENGYYSAGVIVNGTSADGIGGGICQAATTIYNAAIRAGMTVVEREPHTWPSTYVPVGIDSAIDYGAIDMKFRNDTDHEVYLICYMDGATLHAFIYGYKPADFDEIVVSSWFTGFTGIGFGASANRSYYKNGKLVKTEPLPDSFYSNGGGSSYAYDEPLSNYVFERVYTDKQAKKIAAKVAEESKNNSSKSKKSSDTDKDTDTSKEKSSDKDSDKSDSTAENDYANAAITGGYDETAAANAVIEDYTAVYEDTTVVEDIVYNEETITAEPDDDSYDDSVIDDDSGIDYTEEYEEY